MLMARIYQPKGAGPFPTVLDLHGGAWNAKDRRAEEPMDRAIAASGVLVVAIDLTLAPEAPYPACVQDANYAVRWLKTHAADMERRFVDDRRSTAARAVATSESSLRCGRAIRAITPFHCQDRRRSTRRSRYVAMRSPISDPFARFQNAERLKRAPMMQNHVNFFKPWDAIHESNPLEILERREPITKVPLLIMQGALDDNMLPAIQQKFVAAYKAAGGDCQYEVFEGSEHEWVADARTADGQGSSDGEGVHRTAAEGIGHDYVLRRCRECHCVGISAGRDGGCSGARERGLCS